MGRAYVRSMSEPDTYEPVVAVAARPGPFARIVCGVGGSRSAAEAVRQAAVLAGPSTPLVLVSVTDVRGFGPNEMAELGPVRARRALDEARRSAQSLGAHAEAVLVHDLSPAHGLLEAATDADLVVIGAPPGSRLGGTMLGRTASAVLHDAQRSVLIARRTGDRPFPGHIVAATDGSEPAHDAVRVAADLAARHCGDVVLLHARPRLFGAPADARDGALVRERTGREPVWLVPDEPAAAAIPEAAEASGASLVVVGRRGLGGVRALGSVSERVAHRAGCSVLVVRPSTTSAHAVAP